MHLVWMEFLRVVIELPHFTLKCLAGTRGVLLQAIVET